MFFQVTPNRRKARHLKAVSERAIARVNLLDSC